MTKFVVANRLSGKFHESEKDASRAAVAIALGRVASASILSENTPRDQLSRRTLVIEADAPEIAAKRADMSTDVIVEPLIPHWTMPLLPPRDVSAVRPFRAPVAALVAAAIPGFIATVTGGGMPLAHAEIRLFARGLGGDRREIVAFTVAAGQAQFRIPPGYDPTVAVVVPWGRFWPMLVRGAALFEPINCPPLPVNGPIGWWHQIVGSDPFDINRGAGIRVGVVDTGLGPHGGLAHATGIGAFINSVHAPGPGPTQDVDTHGTHVTGIIGAHPTGPDSFAGLAPGCNLFSARVFAGPDASANNDDIANAIDALSRDHTADLINLSLGTTVASEIVQDAIAAALERGTLCICAAGNDGASINYPARFPEAVAVAALGLAGWGPPGSVAASRLPLDGTMFGSQNLFVANFSSHGEETACAAPGVGIISTIPDRHGLAGMQIAMDGTSMASPVACGVLAGLLSQNPAYMGMLRDTGRAQAARQVLRQSLRDVNLKSVYQGRGIPHL